MAGSVFGEILKISTWGESHGAAVGAVIDGCPSGLDINEEYVQGFLNRRRPGQSAFTTQRSEADAVNIMSGVYEGTTLGTPISMMVHNQSQISKDYSDLENVYRPGHADYGFQVKYGIRDHRGGGRSSGRETIGRVMGGAVAEKILDRFGVTFTSYVSKIGNIEIDRSRFDKDEIMRNSLYMPDCIAAAEAEAQTGEGCQRRGKMRGLLPREANIIREQREFLELTQQEVADELEINIQPYQRYEYGEQKVSKIAFDLGLRLCQILELNPYELVLGGGEPPS